MMFLNLFRLALFVALLNIDGSKAKASDTSEPDAYSLDALGKRLAHVARDKREYHNSTSIDKTFSNATILKIKDDVQVPGNATIETSIEVVCNLCYFKGTAGATLTVGGDFNASQAYQTLENGVSSTMKNLTKWVEDIDVDVSEAALVIPPPAGIDFDLQLPDFPECVLEFAFDDAEIYADLSTSFGAGLAYSLTLFTEPLGVELSEDLFLGLIFSVDLILSLESEIKIQHGFHIKLDEGVRLKTALFSNITSDLTLNGGKFESLPVQIESAGTIIHAILRLSVRAGFAFEADLLPGPEIQLGSFDTEDWKASAGLETKVYVNVADLKSNITAFEEDDCALGIQESFQFAVGAGAGAYVGIGQNTWGPRPQTEVPIFPTTFARTCISTKAKATVEARSLNGEVESGMKRTTLTRDVTYTAKGCIEPGVFDCPASAQTIREYRSEETLITAVLSESSATWPETIVATVTSTKEFGDNAVGIKSSTSGSPTPDATGSHEQGDAGLGFFEMNTGGVSNKLIVGLSVGLGVPVLLAIISGIVLFTRKRRSLEESESSSQDASPVSFPVEAKP